MAARQPLASVVSGSKASTVVLVGDVQRTMFWERLALREQNDAARRAVLDEIARERPDAVVFLGDLVAHGATGYCWRAFDRATSAIATARIPAHAILGNHDLMGRRRIALEHFFARFASLARQRWSVCRMDPLALVLLDSNLHKLTDDQRTAQLSWYEAQLASLDGDERVRHTVVCCHHPPFTNSKIVSAARRIEQMFVAPFLAARKARLFFSGHAHTYEHFVRDGHHFIVSGGGGGARHKLRIDPATRRFADQHMGPALRPFHFCRLELQDRALRVVMRQVDDELTTWSVGEEFAVR